MRHLTQYLSILVLVAVSGLAHAELFDINYNELMLNRSATTVATISAATTANNTTGTITVTTQPSGCARSVVLKVLDQDNDDLTSPWTFNLVIWGKNQFGNTVSETYQKDAQTTGSGITSYMIGKIAWSRISSVTWSGGVGYGSTDTLTLLDGDALGMIHKITRASDVFDVSAISRTYAVAAPTTGGAVTATLTASDVTNTSYTINTRYNTITPADSIQVATDQQFGVWTRVKGLVPESQKRKSAVITD